MSADVLRLFIIKRRRCTSYDERVRACCVQCEMECGLIYFSFDKSGRRCDYCFETFLRLCAVLADDHKGVVASQRSRVKLDVGGLHVISVHSEEEVSRLCGCVTSFTSAAGSC